MAQRDIRYCTTDDGVRIAYCVEGEGPPLLVPAAFIESFSVISYFPEEEAFWRAVAQHHRLIRLDWRGTGLSQRNIGDFSVDSACRDIDAVVAALRLRRFAVWVSGSAGPIVLTYAATHGSQVSRLVVYGSNVRTTDTFSVDAMRAYSMLWRTAPDVAAQALADLTGRELYPAEAVQMARMYRESISGEDAALLFEASVKPDWDAQEHLQRIVAPTLVIHRRGDALFPMSAGQTIASGIKNARFLPLEGDVHYHALGDSASVLNAMLAFLAGDAPKPRTRKKAAPAASGVTTILFTDIVGHTEMMQRLGDAKGRDVLREHERITRDLLKQHGGAEVKTMGDGFMASFGSVTSAMECAIALQRAFAQHTESMPEPLHVRVGLNAGEPIQEDGDLFGATVILASRIAAKADAGEILIPEPVRHLLSGKSYVYTDRGEHAMKGFDDAVRLYEVRWRD